MTKPLAAPVSQPEIENRVRNFYAPVPLTCMKTTEGGYGIFAPNQEDINKWPHILGTGSTSNAAWRHAYWRIQEATNEAK